MKFKSSLGPLGALAVAALLLTVSGCAFLGTSASTKLSSSGSALDDFGSPTTRATQSNLRNAFATAKTIYADGQDYTAATPRALSEAEPSLTFVEGDSTGNDVISVATTPTSIVLAARNDDDVCYYLRDDTAQTGTTYASSSTSPCEADQTDGLNFSSDSSEVW